MYRSAARVGGRLMGLALLGLLTLTSPLLFVPVVGLVLALPLLCIWMVAGLSMLSAYDASAGAVAHIGGLLVLLFGAAIVAAGRLLRSRSRSSLLVPALLPLLPLVSAGLLLGAAVSGLPMSA